VRVARVPRLDARLGRQHRDAARQQLRRYVLPPANSLASTSVEAARQWIVLGWVVSHPGAPIWLEAERLDQQAAITAAITKATGAMAWVLSTA